MVVSSTQYSQKQFILFCLEGYSLRIDEARTGLVKLMLQVHYFVQEGADVETEDSSGRTALQLSVGTLDLETQKELLPPDGRVDKVSCILCIVADEKITIWHGWAE